MTVRSLAPGECTHACSRIRAAHQARRPQLVEAIAFFDTLEITDFWERITP
jgi:hypothetical protein